jgi:hypothetical protein
MNGKRKQQTVDEAKRMTPREVLAKGWDLTNAIMALKGMEIPSTIYFEIDGENLECPTRFAALDELAKAIAALDDAIEQLNRDALDIPRYPGYRNVEQLNAARNALLELQRRASQSGCSASTTVIEALFPDVPIAAEWAEVRRWLAIRKEEALRIDPETAEIGSWPTRMFDPYCVLDEWELPEQFDLIGRVDFARAPGSNVWVAFEDLPEDTREKLWDRHSRKLAFPAGLEGLCDTSHKEDDDIPF